MSPGACSCSSVSNGNCWWAKRKWCSFSWLSVSLWRWSGFVIWTRWCTVPNISTERRLFHHWDLTSDYSLCPAEDFSQGLYFNHLCLFVLYLYSLYHCYVIHDRFSPEGAEANKTNRNMVSCFSCGDIIGVPGTCLLLVEIQTVPMALIVPARCYLTWLLWRPRKLVSCFMKTKSSVY